MSALPPKADMCSAQAHVCFGSEADMLSMSTPIRRSNASQSATFVYLLGEGVRPNRDRVGHRRHFTSIYVKAKDVRPRIMAGYVKIELATRNFPAVNVGSENCRTLKIWTCEHSAEG